MWLCQCPSGSAHRRCSGTRSITVLLESVGKAVSRMHRELSTRLWVGQGRVTSFTGALVLLHLCGQMRRISLENVLLWEKSLCENRDHSCRFLHKHGCIFHSWEMSENCSMGTKWQQEPWMLNCDQNCAVCTFQLMKSKSSANKYVQP